MLSLEQSFIKFLNVIFNFIIFLILFIFERDTDECVNRKGAERERDTESEAGSSLRAVSTELDVGLELTDREIMT